MQFYYPTAQLPIYIRALTVEEAANAKRFGSEVAKARDHFRLFRIFHSNYDELTKAIRGHLTIGELDDAEHVELDRVLLNFLAAGRAITDHFSRYFDAKFGDTDDRDELKKYLARLRKNSWGFAFMEDVRNYIQHQGLPIADYRRDFSATSIDLKLTINAEKLTAEKTDSREWWYSKLSAKHGTLDLFEHVREYYLRVTRDLGNFLAKRFVPEFTEAHKFFSKLAAEAKERLANGRMIVFTTFESRNTKYSFVEYPEDVYRELGVTPPQAQPK